MNNEIMDILDKNNTVLCYCIILRLRSNSLVYIGFRLGSVMGDSWQAASDRVWIMLEA